MFLSIDQTEYNTRFIYSFELLEQCKTILRGQIYHTASASLQQEAILHVVNKVCMEKASFVVLICLVISICKTALSIYFVTLACFSVILIYPRRLFSYFTTSSVMIAVTFPLRPPRLAFATCGRTWEKKCL